MFRLLANVFRFGIRGAQGTRALIVADPDFDLQADRAVCTALSKYNGNHSNPRQRENAKQK